MMGLTRLQSEVLTYLRAYISAHGIAPSFSEIMRDVEISNRSHVYRILGCLEDRGAIRRMSKRARAIEIIETIACPHCGGSLQSADQNRPQTIPAPRTGGAA